MALELSYHLNGMQRLRSVFSSLWGSDPIYEALQAGQQRILQDLKTYPAGRGIRYNRSYALAASWTGMIERSSTDAKLRFQNAQWYSKFVQGQRTQAWMHRGRWKTDEQILKENESNFQRELENAFKRRIV